MSCQKCKPHPLAIEFTMAFQPIVSIADKHVWGYETLVRGLGNEPAGFILGKIDDANVHSFDQTIRSKAIKLAHSLNFSEKLSINFLPNAVYKPENCIQSTLAVCEELGFDTQRIMFEVTEAEKITDHTHLKNIFQEYKKHNFLTAIDDFGAGYSGLNLLAEWQPDVIKLDMNLIRDIHANKTKQLIVKGILSVCDGLGISVISEGVESKNELLQLVDFGVNLFQGYYFAKPLFEGLPEVKESTYVLED